MIPDIRPESRFCLPHLHSTPPLGGFPFGMEKLEWLAIRWRKIFENIFIHFGAIHERDGQTQTDTHRMAAKAALMHRIARQ